MNGIYKLVAHQWLRELEGEHGSYPVSYSERCRAGLLAVDARIAS
ncbi:MAG: hypothetical protein ACLP4R_00970 [Solirubrobacteraceae bacterium]